MRGTPTRFVMNDGCIALLVRSVLPEVLVLKFLYN